MVVKSRKVANAVVLTVPSNLAVPEGISFEPSVDEFGNVFFKRVQQVDDDRLTDIHEFMDQFAPLMEKLKDK